MTRLLIIPAAGLGARLGASTPKVLTPVAGRPMLEHLLALYAPVINGVALIVHPTAERQVRDAVMNRTATDVFVQDRPTGMLDAILLARPAVEVARPERVWITWCDQVAIHPHTVARLVELDAGDPLVAMPTCEGPEPYIHMARDGAGRIARVLQRREGDAMPAIGESDSGLFSLSREAYLDLLPQFARLSGFGSGTGERNFLPFLPWASARGAVVTFPCAERVEAVGVNTPEDLAFVERALRARAIGAS